jgi:DNA-binding CsgD family transcriptional regulator
MVCSVKAGNTTMRVQAMTMLQEITPHPGRPRRKFTPANNQKIKDWVAEGISREEIAKSLGVTLGSLQVTCSRLGISLRRRDLSSVKAPGRERLVSSPSAPSIVGQMQAGRPRLYITLECNGGGQTTELPLLMCSAIGPLKLEADIRKLSMGQLLAEVATMAIKKGMFEEILREPAQERASAIAEPAGLQNFA